MFRVNNNNKFVKCSNNSGYLLRFLVIYFLSISLVMASSSPSTQIDPVELLISFDADGQFIHFDPGTGQTTYNITAAGIAPEVKENGHIVPRDMSDDEEHKVIITGAQITFDPFDPVNPPPVINFSCKGCNLSFADGGTLESDTNNVPLIGRALFIYGPVAPNPTKPIASIRMMGCAGLRETSGKGLYANKVGSICFNGVFNFDVSDPTIIPATLTGSSNCTIVMHSPVVPLPPMP